MDWRDAAAAIKAQKPELGRDRIFTELVAMGYTMGSASVGRWLKNWRETAGTPKQTSQYSISEEEKREPATQIEHESSANLCRVTTRSKDIQSPQQALRAIGINPDTVEIIKQRVKTSEVTIGANNTGTGKPETYTNFHVYVEWENQIWRTGLVEFIQRGVRPKQTTIQKYRGGEHLLIPSLYDHHFGKLAWAKETGVSYDLKIAKRLYIDAIASMLSKAKPFGIDAIQIPIGQDFLHIDNQQLTTAAGTPQDVDSRLVKIIDAACEAVIEGVELCRKVAPVTVLWVPGNHDPQTSYYVAKIIEAYYRKSDGVEVDCCPKERKFIEYGCNLIGTTHGSDEKMADLPLIMASEVPDAWARTTHHEWHTGHLHKRKEMRFVSADSYGSVLVRILPSLCGTDKWHYKKGYVGGARAAEAYLYHKTYGYAGHLSANIEELERV